MLYSPLHSGPFYGKEVSFHEYSFYVSTVRRSKCSRLLHLQMAWRPVQERQALIPSKQEAPRYCEYRGASCCLCEFHELIFYVSISIICSYSKKSSISEKTFFFKCRITIDVLQRWIKRKTNESSCGIVKLLDQTHTERATHSSWIL